jgi:aerobic carbon-monoxide dehydrogenase medium subunit
MYPAACNYRAPTSLAEVSRLLGEEEVKLIAGGQSLLPMMRLRLSRPRVVVDLRWVPDLAFIRAEDSALHIGAMTTQATIEDNAAIQQRWPWLTETAAAVGDRQVRNLGTIGGSLAHSDPSADWTAMALANDATISLHGVAGRRTVQVEPFLRGAFDPWLEPTEVVTCVTFPARQATTVGAYWKFRHPASGYAVAGAAIVLSLEDDGHFRDVRVAITGVAPIAYRARRVEEALETERVQTVDVAVVCAGATHGVDALSDTFADAEYRAHLASLVTERALSAALARHSTSART